MDSQKIVELVLLLTHEVGKLHARTAALQSVVEEIRILEPRLAEEIDAAQIQIDSLQDYYSWLEDFDPEIAAMIDNRSERAFDTEGDPDRKFMDDSTGLDD